MPRLYVPLQIKLCWEVLTTMQVWANKPGNILVSSQVAFEILKQRELFMTGGAVVAWTEMNRFVMQAQSFLASKNLITK